MTGNGSVNDLPNKPLWKFRHAGVEARKYRGQIALLAKSQKPTMRTLQFPLDGTPAHNSKELIDIYNVVEGVQIGSLYSYWAALHLAGFKLFSASSDATNFRQLAIFNDTQWNEQFVRSSQHNFYWFKPSTLYAALQKGVRALAGKDVSFTPTTVGNELAKRLIGKSLFNSKNEPNYSEETIQFLNELGEQVCLSAQSWREVNDEPVRGLKKIDEYLQQKGFACPSLVNIVSKLGDTEPAGATIAHVRNGVQPNAFTMQTIYALIASHKPENQTNTTSFVQTEAVTPNASALSWLFAKGVTYFVNTDVQQIMLDFDIENNEDNIAALAHVRVCAKALPTMNLFGQKHYSNFRANFSGKVTSWIANYGNRLAELNALLEDISPLELPDPISQEQSKIFFIGIDSTPQSLSRYIANVQSQADVLKRSLAMLSGSAVEEIVSACTQIAEYSELIDSLGGQLRALKTNIERQKEIAIGTGNASLLALTSECNFEVPKWLKPLPKLNSFSGGIHDVQSTLDESAQVYASLWKYWSQFTDELMAFGAKTFSIYDRVADREASMLASVNPKLNEPRGDRRARRNIVNRIGRMVQNCSEETKRLCVIRLTEIGLFQHSRDLNTWIFNQKGRVYASVMDKSKHGVYPLNDEALMETNWIDWLDLMIGEVVNSNFKSKNDDLLTLKVGKQSLLISGLPEMHYPKRIVEGISQFIGQYADIPRSIRSLIEQEDVHVSTIQKLLNLFASAIKGKAFLVFRQSFVIKMRFAVGGDNTLLYVPKDKAWKSPPQLLKSDLPIGIAARFIAEQGLQDELSVNKIVALQKSDVPEEALQEWLIQSPHDWYYSPIVAGEQAVKAIRVSKTHGNLYQVKNESGFRLLGNSAYKTVLDRALQNKTTLSDMSIIVVIDYRQEAVQTEQGLKVNIVEGTPRWQVSIPLTETIEPKDDSVELFNRIVSFDLGEYGLGYACFDIKTKNRIDSGYKPVDSIKRMLRRVWQYEHRPNIRPKFQSKFNISMSSLRENVVGDICSQINRICEYYNAFPVFESSIGDTGNKQLNSVYEAILTRYLYSGVSAHQAERKQYWLGADSWTHPYLHTPEYKDGKATKNTKPLNIFPGSSTSGKGTSQRCSCCKRNPYDLLSNFKDTDKIAVMNGKVNIEGVIFELRERNPDGKTHLAAKKSNQRAPLQTMHINDNMTVKEIRRQLKVSLRQAPASRQSRSSSVSQYHCVFVDCKTSLKADENAGINIGYKFLEEKTVITA